MSKNPLTAAGGKGRGRLPLPQLGGAPYPVGTAGGIGVSFPLSGSQAPFRKGGVKPHPTFSTVGDRPVLPAWLAPAQSSIASSSSMKPAIMLRPLSQKVGSLASSPKGASSSLWCLEPPAESMSKYFSWKPGVPSA